MRQKLLLTKYSEQQQKKTENHCHEESLQDDDDNDDNGDDDGSWGQGSVDQCMMCIKCQGGVRLVSNHRESRDHTPRWYIIGAFRPTLVTYFIWRHVPESDLLNLIFRESTPLNLRLWCSTSTAPSVNHKLADNWLGGVSKHQLNSVVSNNLS